MTILEKLIIDTALDIETLLPVEQPRAREVMAKLIQDAGLQQDFYFALRAVAAESAKEEGR